VNERHGFGQSMRHDSRRPILEEFKWGWSELRTSE